MTPGNASNDDLREPALFGARLTPHRSLSRAGFVLVMPVAGGARTDTAGRQLPPAPGEGKLCRRPRGGDRGGQARPDPDGIRVSSREPQPPGSLQESGVGRALPALID